MEAVLVDVEVVEAVEEAVVEAMEAVEEAVVEVMEVADMVPAEVAELTALEAWAVELVDTVQEEVAK